METFKYKYKAWLLISQKVALLSGHNSEGHLDVELNEAGRQQAASVADRLSKEPKISAVYSSDLKRALVTAETIAARCGGDLKILTLSLFHKDQSWMYIWKKLEKIMRTNLMFLNIGRKINFDILSFRSCPRIF
ncbi:hypothetical protein REPUB_Repub02eG0187700 [Reevesia pubescens]